MTTKDIVRENLVNLRKLSGLTQIDLAKKVNFSDKAISRWENGDVVPDIDTLEALAKIYAVPISYFFEEHTNTGEKVVNKGKILRNKILYTIVSIMIVWTVAAIVFAYLDTLQNVNYWQIFVWAVPISCLVLIYCNYMWLKIKNVSLYAQSIFIWSLLAGIYLQFLELNLWLVFIVGIPVQITIVARYFLK